LLVNRRFIVLNPAAAVRGERHHAAEGKTPEVIAVQALLNSIDASRPSGKRDKAMPETRSNGFRFEWLLFALSRGARLWPARARVFVLSCDIGRAD
jgi:site-specific recombinase XerC